MYTEGRRHNYRWENLILQSERVHTECHSSWIPFCREGRRDGREGGREGERRHRGGKRRRELETAAGQCVSVRTDDEGEDGRKQGGGAAADVTHISRTVFSCSSFDFFSSISQSLCWPSSTSSRRAMSSTSWKHTVSVELDRYVEIFRRQHWITIITMQQHRYSSGTES